VASRGSFADSSTGSFKSDRVESLFGGRLS
jgi:hypothetical protein